MQEWLDAVLTTEWLLGASMALAGRRLMTWIRTVTTELGGDSTSDADANANKARN